MLSFRLCIFEKYWKVMYFDSDRFIHSRCRHCKGIYEQIQAKTGLLTIAGIIHLRKYLYDQTSILLNWI